MASVDSAPRPGVSAPPPTPAPKAQPRRSPGAGALGLIGGVVLLTSQALRCLVTSPFSWRREALEQAAVLVRRCALPAAISVFVFGYGAVGVEGGTFLTLLGQIDRLGGFYSTGALREYVPWVTGMVVAGVGGTAITADLGARKVRDELEALAVMGVDTTRSLVAPRILAMTLVVPLMNLIGLVFASVAGLVVALTHNGTTAGYLASFDAGFTTVDIIANLVKTMGFGFLIAAICAYGGMNAKGGSEGVGRAVNDSVVQAFAAVWIFNFAFNALYLALFPSALAVR